MTHYRTPRIAPSALLCALTAFLVACGGGPSPGDAEAYITDQLEADGGPEVASVFCDEDESGERYLCEVEYAQEIIDEQAGGTTYVEKGEIE